MRATAFTGPVPEVASSVPLFGNSRDKKWHSVVGAASVTRSYEERKGGVVSASECGPPGS